MISHALQAPNDAYKTVLPWGTYNGRRHLRPYLGIQPMLRAPVRISSGSTCGSCDTPIDRDGVCRCSY